MPTIEEDHPKKTCSLIKLVLGMLAFALVAHILFNKKKPNREDYDV